MSDPSVPWLIAGLVAFWLIIGLYVVRLVLARRDLDDKLNDKR